MVSRRNTRTSTGAPKEDARAFNLRSATQMPMTGSPPQYQASTGRSSSRHSYGPSW